MTRKRGLWVLGLIGSISVASWWALTRPPPPERVASDLAQALVNRDWETLFELTPERERALCGWDRVRFAKLAEGIAREMPRNLAGYEVRQTTAMRRNDQPYRLLFSINFSFRNTALRPTEATARTFPCFVRRGRAGHWHAGAVEALLFMNRLDGAPPSARCRRLARALQNAGMEKLVVWEQYAQIRVSKLLSAAAGKTKLSDVLEPFAE